MRLLPVLLFLALAAPLRADEKPELALQIPHWGYVGAMRFSADGKTLAVGGQDDTIKLWDVATGLICRTLPRGDGLHSFPSTAQEVQSLRAVGVRGWFSLDGIVLPKMTDELILATTLSTDGRFFTRVREEKPPGTGRGATLFVSEAKSGKALWQRVTSHMGSPQFSPDGKWLLLTERGDRGYILQLLGVADGKPGGRVLVAGRLETLRFTSDGKKLYAAVTQFTAKGEPAGSHLQFWTVSDGKPAGAPVAMKDKRFVDALIFPQHWDGRRCLVRGQNTLVARETLTGRTLWQQKVGIGNLHAAEISPDGRFLASAGFIWKKLADTSVEAVALELRDAHSGQLVWQREGSAYGWAAAGFTALGDGRLQTRDSGGLKVWDLTTGRPMPPPTSLKDEPHKIGYSPDGTISIQMAPRDERTRMSSGWELRDTASNELKATLKVPTGGYSGTGAHHFSPNGRYLAVTIWTDVEGSGSFSVFGTKAGKGIKGFQSQGVSVSGIAFSRDETRLASAHIDGTVNLYALPSGELLGRLLGVKAKVNAVTFAPDEKSIFSAHSDGIVRRWNLDAQEISRQWQAHRSSAPSPYDGGGRFSEGGTWSLDFSPDGTLLATCGADGTAKLWDAHSGQLKQTMEHDFAVKSLAFLPNGTLATSASDGAIRLWNLQGGALRATLQSLPGANNWIAFTPEGYYDVAPAAEKFIGWRVGDKVVPAADFTAKFNRPDLLRAALK